MLPGQVVREGGAPPEAQPDAVLPPARRIERQQLGECAAQVGRVRREPRTDPSPHGPGDVLEPGQQDLVLVVEVVGDHAGRAAGTLRHVGHLRGLDAELRDGLRGSGGDALAALVVVDDPGHLVRTRCAFA